MISHRLNRRGVPHTFWSRANSGGRKHKWTKALAFFLALILGAETGIHVASSPASAQVPADPAGGSVAGPISYTYPGISQGDPTSSSFFGYLSMDGSVSFDGTYWSGQADLWTVGGSSAENQAGGSGSISSFNVSGSGFIQRGANLYLASLSATGTGSYSRSGPLTRMSLSGDGEICDETGTCFAGILSINIAGDLYGYDRYGGCYGGDCFFTGLYTAAPPGQNQPPAAPTLLEPADDKVFNVVDPQVFSFRTTDPNGDPYTGEVTIKDKSGTTVQTFPTSPATSSSTSIGSPPDALSPGTYTWSARAADLEGASSMPSESRTFKVNTVAGTLSPNESGPVFRLSISTAKDEANDWSSLSAISGDGRYVAFESLASNLVPGDTNGTWGWDVFVRDRGSGNTTRVSISSSGAQGDSQSGPPAISGDGRYVAFSSFASNLVPGDTNGYPDIFVHDRSTGATTRVSVSSAGGQANQGSFHPSISADGRYVAFMSYASNLVSGDTFNCWHYGNCPDIFLHDRTTGATTLVSLSSSGAQSNQESDSPVISADGRYVAFESRGGNLVLGDTNGDQDIFVRDLATGTTTRESVSTSGNQANSWSYKPAVSANGRYVAFETGATNLVTPDSNSVYSDILVRDRALGATRRVSVNSSGQQADATSRNPSISADGRFIAFDSMATNLVAEDSNGLTDVFVYDQSTLSTVRASVDSMGFQANGLSDTPSISNDGRIVAFASTATNLVSSDINDEDDVFSSDLGEPSEVCGEGFPALVTPIGCVSGERAHAHSDKVGLENFYPYRPWNVGTGSAFVNMGTGNLVAQFADFDVSGQGLGLRLTRTYNSNRDQVDGPLGKGWSIGVASGQAEDTLIEAVQGIANSLDLGKAAEILGTDDWFAFYDADGTRHHFIKGGIDGPGWHSPPGVSLTLFDQVDGLGRRWYKLLRPDGVRFEFRMVGTEYRLTKIADRKGNYLDLVYSNGQLQTITDVKGRTLTFTWSGNYLTKARFQSGAQYLDVNYTVSNGRLNSVTDAAGTSSQRTSNFSYSSGGLFRVTDPRGGQTTFNYSGGKLSSVVDRAVKTWSLTYNDSSCQPLAGFAATATCLTDPESNTSVWTISAPGNLIHHRDEGDSNESGAARRNDRAYSWGANRLRQQIDEAGNTTLYDYNDLGQISRVDFQGVGEPSTSTELTYERVDVGVSDLIETKIGPGTGEVRVWQFSHDSSGNVTSVRDPLGSSTTLTYYVRGLLKSAKDANNKTTTYGNTALSDGGYDASGQPTQITDATGSTMYLTYDFLGLPTQLTDRLGKMWKLEYDLRGNLTKEIDPLGNDTWHCYDLSNNEILTVAPRSPAPSCSLDGTDGYSTKRTYDSRDLPSTVLLASDGQYRKFRYSYYTDGELSTIEEPRNFDPASPSLTTITSPGQVVRYLRYPNNRPRAFVDEEGAQTDVSYTPNGLIGTVVYPSSGAPERHRKNYTYTGRGQIKTLLELGHNAPTTYAYNIHGERIKETDRMGNSTLFDYDKLGRLVKVTDAHGRTTTGSYDPVGNLLSVTQPTGTAGSLTTSYTYTARNEIASETDPADSAHRIEYAYDAESRQRFRYDKYSGSVERTVEQIWRDDGALSERVASFLGTSSGKHRAVFSYDAGGNLTNVDTYRDGAASPNISAITVAYTTANEPKTWTETLYTPTGAGITKASAFTYKPDGLLGSRTVDGLLTSYSYLRNGRESATDPGGALSTFNSSYHPSGALNKTTFGTFEATHSYDLANRPTSKVVKRGATVFSAWEQITYDENDNRLEELATQLQSDGTIKQGSGSYYYDRLNRITWGRHPFETSGKAYALDDAGNVLSDSDFSYSYQANRLTGRKSLPDNSQSFTYAYDHFGNLTHELKNDGSFTDSTYNAASLTHRVSFSTGGAWVEYAYDGLGRLVRTESSSGEVGLFFHDGASDQIVLETDASGAFKSRYVLNSFGAPLAQETSGSPYPAYYVTDPRGNLTQLIDNVIHAEGTNKSVLHTFAYDPFGKGRPDLESASAGWDSRLRFQLAPRDTTTGTYALGPRMYDPQINRFVGADHYVSSSSNLQLQLDPLTGNRYLYAGANPVNMIDDGHAWQWVKYWQVTAWADWEVAWWWGGSRWNVRTSIALSHRLETWYQWEDVEGTCGECGAEIQAMIDDLSSQAYAAALQDAHAAVPGYVWSGTSPLPSAPPTRLIAYEYAIANPRDTQFAGCLLGSALVIGMASGILEILELATHMGKVAPHPVVRVLSLVVGSIGLGALYYLVKGCRDIRNA